jgi:hypothetical protein
VFNLVEKWSNVPIIIAASGKYIYKNNPYVGRDIVYGKTLSYIQHAEVVIGHMSGALDQAIVEKKPIIQLDDLSFTKRKRSGFAQCILRLLTEPYSSSDFHKQDYISCLRVDTERRREIIEEYYSGSSNELDYKIINKIYVKSLHDKGAY